MTSLQATALAASMLGGIGIMVAIVQPDLSRLRAAVALTLGVGGFLLCLAGVGFYFYFEPSPPKGVVQQSTESAGHIYKKGRDAAGDAWERMHNGWRDWKWPWGQKKKEEPNNAH